MKHTPGLRLGTVGGVPVILTAGWLIVAAVFGYTFTQISQTRLGLDLGPAIAFALTIPVMLGFSVLAHELAHGLTAQRYGMAVREYVITLWGGHTMFAGELDRPGSSAAVAFAGPAANVVLAAIGWAGGLLTDGVASFFFVTLSVTNGLLALFNLLPAAPLDGGKLAAAAIWRVTGNKLTGLRATGRLGQLLAVAVGVGVAWWIYATRSSNILVMALGVFFAMDLWRGAVQTLKAAKIRASTEGFRLEPYLVSAQVVKPTAMANEIHRLPSLVTGLGADAEGFGLIDEAAFRAVPPAQRSRTPVTALVTLATVHVVTTPHGSESISEIAQGLSAGASVLVYGAHEPLGHDHGEVWLVDIDRLLAELKQQRP